MMSKYISILLLFLSLSAFSKSPVKWSERMAQSEMTRFPESWMIEKSKVPRWSYTHGLVNDAFMKLWVESHNSRYFDYARIYADSTINAAGKIKMNYLSFNIDNVNAGKFLFELYEKTGKLKYKTAIDTLRKQMKEHPRTSEGGFWHKKIYPHQMWLDGIFMASPFLAEYALKFNEPELFDDVTNQILLIAEKTYDKKTGLYFHGWDESRQQAWSDKLTGCSPNFWSRSIGWYAMALVDVLDYLPENHKDRKKIEDIVNRLAKALINYQDKKTGVWYQVTDQGNRKGNYLESSACAMFVYFLSKAVNNSYLDASYKKPIRKAFKGMIKQFIDQNPDGTISITNCCAVAGLGGTKVYRDGSFNYYISEPVIVNDPKSTGSFILAAIEYEKLK